MSEVDFVQDSDLNKSLRHYCLEILDEFDEVFLEYFMAPELPENVAQTICTERSKLCKERDESQRDEDDEEDSYLLEKEL